MRGISRACHGANSNYSILYREVSFPIKHATMPIPATADVGGHSGELLYSCSTALYSCEDARLLKGSGSMLQT
jgi:hypothetical protein